MYVPVAATGRLLLCFVSRGLYMFHVFLEVRQYIAVWVQCFSKICHYKRFSAAMAFRMTAEVGLDLGGGIGRS